MMMRRRRRRRKRRRMIRRTIRRRTRRRRRLTMWRRKRSWILVGMRTLNRARGILEDTGPTRRPRINPANSKGF
jgi:hypothetical protein